MFYLKIFITVFWAIVVALFSYDYFSKKKTDAHYSEYSSASYLIEGLSASSQAKHLITIHYHMNEKFPSSNQDIGIPSPEEFVGQSLIKLEVSNGGIITLTYNEKSGVNNGIIQLKPKISKAMGIQWGCSTPSYEKIAQFIDRKSVV